MRKLPEQRNVHNKKNLTKTDLKQATKIKSESAWKLEHGASIKRTGQKQPGHQTRTWTETETDSRSAVKK